MDRRGFIKTTGTLIAGATLAPGALAADRNASGDSGVGGRMELPMNRGWLYSKTAEAGATSREFNDAQLRARGRAAHEHQVAVARLH